MIYMTCSDSPPVVFPTEEQNLSFAPLHSPLHSTQGAWEAKLFNGARTKDILSCVDPEPSACVRANEVTNEVCKRSKTKMTRVFYLFFFIFKKWVDSW